MEVTIADIEKYLEEVKKAINAGKELVPLYIKFNKLEAKYVIVISFHKQRHSLEYKFK